MPDAPLDSDLARLVDELCAIVPDFPIPGISFRDLTPVFADGPAFTAVVDGLAAEYRGRVDAVAGIEARGFVLAAAAAYALGTGVVIIRKPGKLPRPHLEKSYDLEYGSATLEVHPDDLAPGARVLVLDDVLATGGTLGAAVELIEEAGWHVEGVGVVLELEALAGRAKLGAHRVRSILAI